MGIVARSLVLLSLAGLVLGCAAPPMGPEPQPDNNPETPQLAGDDIRQGTYNRQVVTLWEEANAELQAGDYTRAGVRIEQAIRLAPGEPVLWSRMAEILLLKGESARAENTAVKSNALSGERPDLLYRNWMIIRYARENRGDDQGVLAAQQQLDKLKAPE